MQKGQRRMSGHNSLSQHYDSKNNRTTWKEQEIKQLHLKRLQQKQLNKSTTKHPIVLTNHIKHKTMSQKLMARK